MDDTGKVACRAQTGFERQARSTPEGSSPLPSARNTQRKGDIAATQAIATFTRLGYDVSVPVSESTAYDIVIDDAGTLKRVQVKFCGRENHEVDLRGTTTNYKGTNKRFYTSTSFDWLYVLRSDGNEFLFMQDLSGRTSIAAKHEADLLTRQLGS